MIRGQWRLGAVVGLLGALLGLTPAMLALEEQLGLSLLFALRGEQSSPAEVAIVAISGDSAEAYGLPAHLREWPRQLHAQLIARLTDAGAAAIVFDVAFESRRDAAGDTALAEAIGRSGRVILLEQIRAADVALPGLQQAGRQLRQVPAAPVFAEPALGTGPFTLPTVPIRTSRFWTFGAGASHSPMLPSLALQAYLLDAYPSFVTALAQTAPLPAGLPRAAAAVLEGRDLQAVMRMLRRIFADDPGLPDRLEPLLDAVATSPAERRSLGVLADLYSGSVSRYLNFYGPSGTIPAWSFHGVVPATGPGENLSDLAGRVVFVGFAESEQSEQQDEFISVYSQASGLSLSGVEIGATAFANLLAGTTLRPLPLWVQAPGVLLWAMALSLAVARFSLPFAYLTAACLAGAALWLAVGLFDAAGYWLPLVLPLAVQLPAIVLGDTLLRYRRLAIQRERLRQALGPYAAPTVVARLARDMTGGREAGRVVHGTCIVTDVAGYTSLAETVPPQVLADLMDAYFRLLGGTVTAHGGTVGDVSGDSMVGLWVAAGPSAATSRRAVTAALDMQRRVAAFNRDRSRTPLLTPIGLETGPVALSRDGAVGEGSYRPVGDIVNTASRIQGLNRVLGTQLLVSGAVYTGIDHAAARRLGRFLLLGKRRPLDVWEVASTDASGSPLPEPVWRAAFSVALAEFAAGNLAAAHAAFMELLVVAPTDGPSLFYLRQCNRLLDEGLPPDWDGTIVMTSK